MTDIWDISAPIEADTDIWGQGEPQGEVVGPDVVQELGLTTEVYSGAFKRRQWKNGTWTGGTEFTLVQGGKLYQHLGHCKGAITRDLNYGYNHAVQPPDKMILKGTITWEIVPQ